MSSSHPRLYGRRKGRPLRARKAQIVEELLPRLRITLPGEKSQGIKSNFIDPVTLFEFRADTVWLEIGFGGGEHLAAQANSNPAIGFIGCEPFVNGVAGLLDHIDRNRTGNIRIFPDDARPLLDALPDAAIDRCFVLFPDPWPKARHAERRFIAPENLLRLARVMRAGAELRLASDDAGMIVWFRERMQEAAGFCSVSDSCEPPGDWVPTRYAQKAFKAGRKPVYMTYQKI